MKIMKPFAVPICLLIFTFITSAQSEVISGFPSTPINSGKLTPNFELGLPSPNELEGYKFFSEGRLSKLKIGISTREDVKSIFGSKILGTENNELFDYDSDWSVQISYFDVKLSKIGQSHFNPQTQTSVSKILIPSPEYLGKIYSIRLTPKKTVSFLQIAFPSEFNKQSVPLIDEVSENPSVTIRDLYVDSYGLEYEIFNQIARGNLDKRKLRSQGDLITIRYTIPHKLRDKIFVEQK